MRLSRDVGFSSIARLFNLAVAELNIKERMRWYPYHRRGRTGKPLRPRPNVAERDANSDLLLRAAEFIKHAPRSAPQDSDATVLIMQLAELRATVKKRTVSSTASTYQWEQGHSSGNCDRVPAPDPSRGEDWFPDHDKPE